MSEFDDSNSVCGGNSEVSDACLRASLALVATSTLSDAAIEAWVTASTSEEITAARGFILAIKAEQSLNKAALSKQRLVQTYPPEKLCAFCPLWEVRPGAAD